MQVGMQGLDQVFFVAFQSAFEHPQLPFSKLITKGSAAFEKMALRQYQFFQLLVVEVKGFGSGGSLWSGGGYHGMQM
jgi:hypothetical protein